ncbi:MAG TPA: hypothetical protein PLZ51_07105 [Aggregatilineales bacterium]|nr:hypothetical protein [Aggregatilineales bacterium]
MTNFIVTLSDDLIKSVNIKAQEKQLSPNEIVILALDNYFADDSQDDPTTEEIIAMVEQAIEDADAGRVHTIDEFMASLEADMAYLNDNIIHKTKFTAQLSPELIDLIYTKVDEEGFSVDFVVRAALSMYFDDN